MNQTEWIYATLAGIIGGAAIYALAVWRYKILKEDE